MREIINGVEIISRISRKKGVREIMESSKEKTLFREMVSWGNPFRAKCMIFSDLQRAFQGLIQQGNFA